MFNQIGLPGIILIAVVVLILFGRGKISSLMGEVGKGITSFKKGISEGKRELDKNQEEVSESVKDITPEKDMPIAAIPSAIPAFASNQFATSLVTDKLPKAGPPTAIKVA